jgi:branched-chain amino acid transport system ATP-binding protein
VKSEANSDALLSVRGVSRRFGGVRALSDVSFAVRPACIKAIIGPNGAGKSTLFNLIAGDFPPHGGVIEFDGRVITGLAQHAIAALGIARTYQTTRLFEHMTVLENVMVGRHVRSRAGFVRSVLRLPGVRAEEKSIRKKAGEILDLFGLGAYAAAAAGSLAFGIKRKVEFARAVASEPALLLLDEPAAGLNIGETRDVSSLISTVKEMGITVLLVEHDMSLVMNISDEILVLNEGTKLVEGAPRDVQRHPDVIRVYLGEDECSSSGT